MKNVVHVLSSEPANRVCGLLFAPVGGFGHPTKPRFANVEAKRILTTFGSLSGYLQVCGGSGIS